MKKKITVKHFQNKKLRPWIANDIKYYPYYIQIVYNRSNTKIKSVLFDRIFSLERSFHFPNNFLLAKEMFSFDSQNIDLVPFIDPDHQLCKSLQEYDLKIIKLTVEKLIQTNPEFTVRDFQEASQYYLKDVLPLIEEQFFLKIFPYVEKNQLINYSPLQGIKLLYNLGHFKPALDLIEEILGEKRHEIKDVRLENLYHAYRNFSIILQDRLNEALIESKIVKQETRNYETGPGFEIFYCPYIIFNDPSFNEKLTSYYPDFKFINDLVSSLKLFHQ